MINLSKQRPVVSWDSVLALPFTTSTASIGKWPLSARLVGAVIMSERSHNTLIVRQFSIGLAPDRNGNLAAIATLRF